MTRHRPVKNARTQPRAQNGTWAHGGKPVPSVPLAQNAVQFSLVADLMGPDRNARDRRDRGTVHWHKNDGKDDAILVAIDVIKEDAQ